MKRVVITGISAKCCVGNNAEEIIENILEGKSAIGLNDMFKHLQLDYYPIGALKENVEIFDEGYIQEKTHFLAKGVIDSALVDARIDSEVIRAESEAIGLSFGASTLKVLKMQEFMRRKIAGETYVPLLLVGDSFLHSLAAHVGINGEAYNTSTACSSSTAAVGLAFDMIRHNGMDIVIACASDPLVDLSITGFHVLQTLSRDVCRPFDRNRSGINIGEAAVCFIVEEYEHAIKRNAAIYAEVLGYGLANDAYSMTAPDPEGRGAYDVMKEAVDMSGLTLDDVGYINAHGTGTLLNDEMEAKAISKLFGNNCNPVRVSSTKSYTGHCLATAGAIELAITIFCLKRGLVPFTHGLNDENLGSETIHYIKNKPDKTGVVCALSNSFAFGGNAASILIKVRKTEEV